MNVKASHSSTTTGTTLVLICRRPTLGIGKQRIAADLGDNLTFELAQRLLATTLEDATAWPGPVIIAPSAAGDASWAEKLLERPVEVIAQPEGNLGDRICSVDAAARFAGHKHIVYIGSDAPVLAPAYFRQARMTLAEYDIVLGPAEDGGVTLMGASSPWPELTALPWSSEKLGQALELLCHKQGLNVMQLETRYDIDLAMDLPRLRRDLADDPRPARRELLSWLDTTGLGNTLGDTHG